MINLIFIDDDAVLADTGEDVITTVFAVLVWFGVSLAGEDVAFVVSTREADAATNSARAAAAKAQTSSMVCFPPPEQTL